VSFVSERWERLKDKEYRDGYMEAQFEIELPFQLQALRTARGWTHDQLSERSGIPEEELAKLEEPGCASFVPDILCRLASAFDVGLLVQFVPFSHLVHRAAALRPGTFDVVSFKDDTVEGTVEATGWEAITDTVSTNQQESRPKHSRPSSFTRTTSEIYSQDRHLVVDQLPYYSRKHEGKSTWQIRETDQDSPWGLQKALTSLNFP
jgi:transcriptional regulator with XRE-family HTH domain